MTGVQTCALPICSPQSGGWRPPSASSALTRGYGCCVWRMDDSRPLVVDPPPMVLDALKTFISYVRPLRGKSYTGQPPLRPMPYGEEGLSYLLVCGRSRPKAKARYDSYGVDGHKQTETFVPSQAIAPSNVGAAG